MEKAIFGNPNIVATNTVAVSATIDKTSHVNGRD